MASLEKYIKYLKKIHDEAYINALKNYICKKPIFN